MKRIDRVVPSDGYFVGATDPETTLSLGAGIVHDLPYDACQPTWDHEFLVPDYLKFADIARERARRRRSARGDRWAAGALPPLARLRQCADGLAPRCARCSRRMAARGASASSTGSATARATPRTRRHGSSASLRSSARRCARPSLTEPAECPADRGPGIVVLDADGSAVSATSEAAAWFEEIDPHDVGDAVRGNHVRGTCPRAQPRARARRSSLAPASERGRASGSRCTPRMLEGTDQLALVIEPAKASEVAPLIVEAYGFTERELEVTRAIARGLGTAEIAAHLFVSQHTVRDHVKSVFEKVGVSSRGELVAKVFADNYSPVLKHAD